MSDPTPPDVRPPASTIVPPPPVLPEALQAAESPVRKWPLIATGVLFLVCGLRILVMAVQAAILYASSYNMLSPLIIMALAVECVLLAVLVPLGISLVRRRNWARIGGAVVSILYVALYNAPVKLYSTLKWSCRVPWNGVERDRDDTNTTTVSPGNESVRRVSGDSGAADAQ